MNIFLGKGDGTFQARQSFTQTSNYQIINEGPQLVDLDGDGLLDIVGLAENLTAQPVEVLTVALSKGVKRDPNLGFLLHVQNGAPSTASSVVLEASTNLADWTPLATKSPVATWPFVDTSAGLQQRYYRTRRP